MSELGPLKAAKATVTTVGEVIKIAADNPDARAAGGQVAKTALTAKWAWRFPAKAQVSTPSPPGICYGSA